MSHLCITTLAAIACKAMATERLEQGHHRHHACDCAGHRKLARNDAAPTAWGALLPILACAICPACLSMYAKLLSLAGVGFGLSEAQHHLLLAVAVTASVLISAWRTWRTGRAWPVATAALGAGLILVAHLAGDLHVAEWAGVLVLLAGGLVEQFRFRRAAVSLG
jgi:hypothetical protein